MSFGPGFVVWSTSGSGTLSTALRRGFSMDMLGSNPASGGGWWSPLKVGGILGLCDPCLTGNLGRSKSKGLVSLDFRRLDGCSIIGPEEFELELWKLVSSSARSRCGSEDLEVAFKGCFGGTACGSTGLGRLMKSRDVGRYAVCPFPLLLDDMAMSTAAYRRGRGEINRGVEGLMTGSDTNFGS